MNNMNNEEILKENLKTMLTEEIKQFLKDNLKIKLTTTGSNIRVSLILGDEIISSDVDFVYTSTTYE